MNITVREFTDHMWYTQPMVIVPQSKLHDEIDIEKIKANAIYVGTPHELNSDIHKNIYNMSLDSYGIIDDYLIILVH